MERISRYQGINLYIKNLEDDIDEERLKKEFSTFGVIRSAKIPDDKGNSKGFGFVCYTSAEEAQNAINEMNNRILQGCSKPLYVALHEPKEIRRTKLAQRHAARKIRMNPPSAAANPPIPYQFYGNGNVPASYVYPPPTQQLLPRQRAAPSPAWPQPSAYTNPAYSVPTSPPSNPVRPGPSRGGARGPGGPRGPRAPPGVAQRRPPVPGGNIEHATGPIPMENTLSLIKTYSFENQKLLLGEQLFPLIVKVDPLLAGKITGMLLDSGWSVEELYSLVGDEVKLRSKIDEARMVLELAEQGNDVRSSVTGTDAQADQ